MDHIETKILNSYTIQEAAQNMVFAARLVFWLFIYLRNRRFSSNGHFNLLYGQNYLRYKRVTNSNFQFYKLELFFTIHPH